MAESVFNPESTAGPSAAEQRAFKKQLNKIYTW